MQTFPLGRYVRIHWKLPRALFLSTHSLGPTSPFLRQVYPVMQRELVDPGSPQSALFLSSATACLLTLSQAAAGCEPQTARWMRVLI